jgi:Tfp pilus assembly protein PilF
MIFADVYNLIGMEYLFMDNLEMAKKILSNVLEEDRRSTGLIQRGILF